MCIVNFNTLVKALTTIVTTVAADPVSIGAFDPLAIPIANPVSLGVVDLVPTAVGNILSQPLTTADRVRSYGYPVEEHTVTTSDAYILKLFRIPYSPKLRNKRVRSKPVIFLQHGLFCTSDCLILNGPDNALPYLLVDAGYDVWLGNARGNTYSRKHVYKTPLLSSFWDFSWNEIGVYDLPAMIDYVLDTTHEDALHYVGHSQGTTVFFVLLSTMPRYNKKIKTSHMLAPVGYMDHAQTRFFRAVALLLGRPTLLYNLIGSSELKPSNKLLSMLGSEACAEKAVLQPMCVNVWFLIIGWDSKHFNDTLFPDVIETFPDSVSTKQIIHYLQEIESGYFRRFDFGKLKNIEVYKSAAPTDYVVENIRPEVPVEFYYSGNDSFAAVVDVERFAERLGNHVRMYRVKYSLWNHGDFIWALEVKEVINDRVIRLVNKYEGF